MGMYSVVEFAEEDGGGISIVRGEWLSPKKQRCMWPPQKLMNKFNKIIDGTIAADTNSWKTFNIRRVFYETDVIAKHLAQIENDVKELQIAQHEILIRVRSSSLTPLENSLPAEIKLPCDDQDDLSNIESWIKTNSTDNRKLLITYLSLVGGNKTAVIIRRILEKLFTNKLAVICNWTGQNNKIYLKDLELIKIIRDAVRLNHIAAKATDAEIHEYGAGFIKETFFPLRA